MSKEIMLDLETLGNCQNSVIVSIGAVEFSLDTDKTGLEFYEKVSIESCLEKGLQVNGSTIEWWLKQNEKARFEIGKNTDSLMNVLANFTQYFYSIVGMGGTVESVNIWGNPASFDIGILSNAYDKCKLSNPWSYRNERDLRTLVTLHPEIKANWHNIGVEHNPIDDCKYQIGYTKAIYNEIIKLTLV